MDRATCYQRRVNSVGGHNALNPESIQCNSRRPILFIRSCCQHACRPFSLLGIKSQLGLTHITFEYYNLLQGFAELVQTGETVKIVTEGGEVVNNPKRGAATLPKV